MMDSMEIDNVPGAIQIGWAPNQTFPPHAPHPQSSSQQSPARLVEVEGLLARERQLRVEAENRYMAEQQQRITLQQRVDQLEKQLAEATRKRKKDRKGEPKSNDSSSSSSSADASNRVSNNTSSSTPTLSPHNINPNGVAAALMPGSGSNSGGSGTNGPSAVSMAVDGAPPAIPVSSSSSSMFPLMHPLASQSQWNHCSSPTPFRRCHHHLCDGGRVHFEVSRNVLVVEENSVRLQKLEDLLVWFYGYEFVNPYRTEQRAQTAAEDEAGLVSVGTANDIFSRLKGIAAKEQQQATGGAEAHVAKSLCSVEMLMNPTTSSAQRIFDLLNQQYSMYQDHQFTALKEMATDYAETLLNLCSRARDILLLDKLLLTLESPIYVMGDVHGSFHDVQFFLHHLINFGQMCYTANKLLFLGDYVDRGPASLEVAALLLSMKCLTPDSVFLLRGNHETTAVNGNCAVYGRSSFLYQCCNRFGEDVGRRVFTAFNEVFSVMPLAAEVNKTVFCVHGGIPRPAPGETVVDCLERLRQRDFPRLDSVTPDPNDDPATARCKAITLGLLWSDPASTDMILEDDGYGSNAQRGEGAYVFGQAALNSFLQQTGYEYIIRAHEVKQQGLRLCQNGRVITVFTSSAYCGGDNAAGAVYLAKGKIRMISCLRNWERSLSSPINISSTAPPLVAQAEKGAGAGQAFNSTAQSKVDHKSEEVGFHTCEHCGDVLCKYEVDSHRMTCPEELVKCSRCDDSFPRYALNKHSETCCDPWI